MDNLNYMTFLEKELKRRNITIYALCKALGKDPNGSEGWMRDKVRGNTSLTISELNAISLAIQNISGKPIDPKQVPYQIERLFVV